MPSLFAKPKKGLKRKRPAENEVPEPAPADIGLPGAGLTVQETADHAESTFESLGLCDWLVGACGAMGFKSPTAVQKQCIPAVLAGKDVLGCAETGSGKTAAFALPILHDLSKDPYGIFALILTPTRELAIQIEEQFGVLGALMSLRHSVVIGGMGMMDQAVELSRRPHVVIATPGRLRDHLQGPQPPNLSRCRYLVLDEADRLLSMGFQSEIRCVLEALPARRQTLLFSATMTTNLEQLRALAMTEPVLFDLTKRATVPATLKQEYLFMPVQMKTPFLAQVLRVLVDERVWGASGDDADRGGQDDEEASTPGAARSAMIFVGSCKRCQELAETLLQLGVDCVCLHSVMSQRRRLAALGKFKSSRSHILVSTDVASRGLDIPEVDLVVNFDMPRVATDYVHRVGRTARAGRRGRAISLVSQYDVELVHNVEEYTGGKLSLCEDIKEVDVLKLLNTVSKASRVAKMRLMEQGFDDTLARVRQRKTNARHTGAAAQPEQGDTEA